MKVSETGIFLDALGNPIKLSLRDCPKSTILQLPIGHKTIPDGWHICDGTRNTPDLRSKAVPEQRYIMKTEGA
jgi:hypothetical protein